MLHTCVFTALAPPNGLEAGDCLTMGNAFPASPLPRHTGCPHIVALTGCQAQAKIQPLDSP